MTMLRVDIEVDPDKADHIMSLLLTDKVTLHFEYGKQFTVSDWPVTVIQVSKHQTPNALRAHDHTEGGTT